MALSREEHVPVGHVALKAFINRLYQIKAWSGFIRDNKSKFCSAKIPISGAEIHRGPVKNHFDMYRLTSEAAGLSVGHILGVISLVGRWVCPGSLVLSQTSCFLIPHPYPRTSAVLSQVLAGDACSDSSFSTK